MEAGKGSSLIIWAFLFVMILQFFSTCLASRNLADSPQPNGSNQSEENNDPCKSMVGAPATGQSAPATIYCKSVSSKHSNGSVTHVTSNNNGVTNNTTETWSDDETKESESSSTVNGNGGGGGQVYMPPNAVYEPPAGLEDPRFNFPPLPPFHYP